MQNATAGTLTTGAAMPGRVAYVCSHAVVPSTVMFVMQEAAMPPQLRAELAELERFSTTRFFGQLVEPLQPVTYRTVTKHYVK